LLSDGIGRFVTWPSFAFRNERGDNVDLYRDIIARQSVILNFFYTRCEGGCPETFTRMHSIAKAGLGRANRSRFVSITIDPDHDSHEVLRSFRQSLAPRGADWTFLSGDLDVTNSLRRFLNFYDLDEEAGPSARRHASMVLIGSDLTHRWITLPAMASVRQWHSAVARCAG
jgi:cytochrome oxidase Cu insertion factor (SCO1/SenC/PrrC family)